jgi:hypothetical protein
VIVAPTDRGRWEVRAWPLVILLIAVAACAPAATGSGWLRRNGTLDDARTLRVRLPDGALIVYTLAENRGAIAAEWRRRGERMAGTLERVTAATLPAGRDRRDASPQAP